MSVSLSGFALRNNGSCPSNGVDCGRTVSPYHACCPADTFCPTQYNVDCCPSSTNCTASLVEDPHCANETWDLYDNGGYFCCETGFTGYSAGGSDGCASPGYAFQSGQVLLPIIKSGQVIKPTSLSTHAASSTAQSSSSSTSANSSSGSATPAPTVAPKNHSTTQTGPIVGGVVGGVGFVILAAIAFWLWRRRRPVAPNEIGEPLPRHEMAHEKYSIAPPLGEMEGHHTFYGQPLRPSELHG